MDFQDEVSAAFRASDGVLLVVDAVEGAMLVTEKVVKQAVSEGLSIALLITKVDRLITELKLPPSDAYHKLHHTIQEVNALIASHSGSSKAQEVSNCLVTTWPVFELKYCIHPSTDACIFDCLEVLQGMLCGRCL